MAVFSLGSTMVAGICIITKLIQTHDPDDTPPSSDITFQHFFVAFASILFAFGGAPQYPTIQNDMKQREKFPLAVTISFSSEL